MPAHMRFLPKGVRSDLAVQICYHFRWLLRTYGAKDLVTAACIPRLKSSWEYVTSVAVCAALRRNGLPWSKLRFCWLTSEHKLQLLIYAVQSGCELKDCVSLVTFDAPLECFVYYMMHGGRPTGEVRDHSALGHTLERLAYVCQHGWPIDYTTASGVCQSGSIAKLHYLDLCGFRWTSGEDSCHPYGYRYGLCRAAAQAGTVVCLKFLRDRGCDWDNLVCFNAAQFGSLECLQYAHENGCPMDVMTLHAAVDSGMVECLRYAHTHGCPYDKDYMRGVINSVWHKASVYAAVEACCAYVKKFMLDDNRHK